MRFAMIYPEALNKGGRGIKKTSANLTEVSDSHIKRARFVLANAPTLAREVLSGARPLHNAYEEAKARKKEAESETAMMAELQANWVLPFVQLRSLAEMSTLSCVDAHSGRYWVSYSKGVLLKLDPRACAPIHPFFTEDLSMEPKKRRLRLE